MQTLLPSLSKLLKFSSTIEICVNRSFSVDDAMSVPKIRLNFQLSMILQVCEEDCQQLKHFFRMTFVSNIFSSFITSYSEKSFNEVF